MATHFDGFVNTRAFPVKLSKIQRTFVGELTTRNFLVDWEENYNTMKVKKPTIAVKSEKANKEKNIKKVRKIGAVGKLVSRKDVSRKAKDPYSSSAKGITKKKKSSKVNSENAPNKKKGKKSYLEDVEGVKDIDPEFYDFLKKNDKKLLEFNVFDSDEEEDASEQELNKKTTNDDTDDDEVEEGDEDDEEKYHKPSGTLEVASDESDFEDDEHSQVDTDGTQKVTLNLLRQWQTQLETQNAPIDAVRKAIQAFSSALASVSGDAKESSQSLPFKVVGAAAFNGVVQLCVLHLQPAILRILGVTPRSSIPLHKTKKWAKVRSCLRYYLTDLIRLVEQVSSPNILSVLLKHLHQMAGMVAPFSSLGKTILKRLIVLWSTGDETVRVLSFLCILKITRNQQATMLNHVLKAMYLSYVRNSKFVSPNTLSSINFMRRSLVEMFALDLNVAYQHAFLYIRQLAIHLRNAVILKKKDSLQAVYNWQYINSLRLWTDLLGGTADKPQLQPLIYPLVTIAIGVVRLIPTAQYFPLRFHCLQALISLAKETHTFVPVLPLIMEVLRSNTFNRKHTVVSMRPLQFTCVLRLNKAQLSENGFRDEVVDQVCGLTLEYLAHESTSLAFSDLVVPTVMSLKSYLKQCRNANHSRKLKQLLDKIQENVRFIDEERRKITFGLTDLSQVQAWETLMRNKGTPLDIYYSSWVKTHEIKKRRQAAQSDSINSDYNLPAIKRPVKSTGAALKKENGEVELFPSDSDDEELSELPVPTTDGDGKEKTEPPLVSKKTKKPKEQRLKKKKTTAASDVDMPVEEADVGENVDIVKDLDLDDW